MKRSLRLAICTCVVAWAGCGPTMTRDVRPVIQVRHDSGIFSIDTLFDLKEFEVHELTDGVKTAKATNQQWTLHEVKLIVEVLYDHGPPQKENVFWSRWKPGEQKILNTPARAHWEGVNAQGTAIVMNGASKICDVDINLAWRLR